LLHSFQLCTVVSERERELFVRTFPEHKHKIEVVPNCIDVESYRGVRAEPKPNHLIFSGPFRYRANYDAMQWFIREVYPQIVERIPDTHLIITGDHEDLPLPPAKNVIRAGNVKDIKSLIASCSVSLAPLWVGGGTRLKILEAMALGTPVVSTSKGSEGLGVTDGEHLLIADTAEAFAAGVLAILEDSNLRQQLAIAARRFVENHFSWDAKLPRFLQLVDVAAQKRYNFGLARYEH
jgi:glycosyltransferase involved in cell wall biosynthesis